MNIYVPYVIQSSHCTSTQFAHTYLQGSYVLVMEISHVTLRQWLPRKIIDFEGAVVPDHIEQLKEIHVFLQQ